ncbi:5-bromo-4-chloroindolyl phosphate hydrolysis family protein [Erwinia sp. HR93]|uniref:5-bromo-4-chloroindolyl phosphate hydrolysis family protein n=1 Tax=Erwinia sp. HR93 TaxID=3094840 RepID=UPI002ADEB9CF|nr:5-bromo-4-chloroindolyl phosphate hydrolysis family protein [Erwinia sp. HR93]MEA1063132.1 5-bromo-4-chloroindolyl phosphate hydrolysis family protein [Erwinia sp. HR93]
MNNSALPQQKKLSENRWLRGAIVFVMLVLADAFQQKFLPLADHLTVLAVVDDLLDGVVLIYCWIAGITLARTLLEDRAAFLAGCITGLLWLPFGDTLALPFWAGAGAMLAHVFNRRRSLSKMFILYALLWIIAIIYYLSAYSFSDSVGYLFLFMGILIGYIIYRKNVEAGLQNSPGFRATAPQPQRQTAASLPTPPAPDQIAPFEAEILRLEALNLRPESIAREVAIILRYARLIQQCMQTDPRDEEPATQFLRRYLPALEDIVIKSQRLSHQLEERYAGQQHQENSLAILQALRSAFRQKHAQLLENDETEFSSEISTLEKLLKSDGFL